MDGGIRISKLITLLLVFFILILSSGIGTANEIFVKSGESIQSAVNNAASGDVVIVKPGTYTENINVTVHNLVIKSESENPADTIIMAKDPALDVFNIQANKVTISGFKIMEANKDHAGVYMYKCKNCTIENSRLLNNTIGVHLKNSDYNSVLDNLIGKGDKGVVTEQSNYNTISGNRASKNRYGFYVPNSEGNVISNNTLSENKDYGIVLSTGVDNTISENNASDNGRGIYLGNSDNNKISSNTITSNEVFGLFVCPKSDKNSVLNNYFNNTVNAVPNNGTDNIYYIEKTPGTNIVGGPYLAGNYWAQPNGTGPSEVTPDADGDGIADKVYRLENSDYVDRRPLVAAKVKKPILPVANFSTNATSGHPPLSVKFTDLSKNETEINWDFESDGNIDSTDENPVHIFTEPGTYTVNLTASNENGTASKNYIIVVLEGQETQEPVWQNKIESLPGFELIYGIFGLLAVFLYRKR
ncbi:cell surface protein [Methanosarcina barkeri CM1]|uniref:Cell surface protein n=1 Tax=Methanosarcina barkeri CM1 TaxID=796385 RepID=A0A0G3C6R9_METBA|nr:cell surface protein [Methanosarcina barkeri CM1]